MYVMYIRQVHVFAAINVAVAITLVLYQTSDVTDKKKGIKQN